MQRPYTASNVLARLATHVKARLHGLSVLSLPYAAKQLICPYLPARTFKASIDYKVPLILVLLLQEPKEKSIHFFVRKYLFASSK